MGGVNHPQMAGLWHWVSHMNDLISDHLCSKIWWDVYHVGFYLHSCRNFLGYWFDMLFIVPFCLEWWSLRTIFRSVEATKLIESCSICIKFALIYLHQPDVFGSNWSNYIQLSIASWCSMISWCGKPLTSRLRMAVRPLILVKLGMAVFLGLHGLTTLLYVGLSETPGQSSFFPFSGHFMGILGIPFTFQPHLPVFFAHQVALGFYHVFTRVISPRFLVKSPILVPSRCWTLSVADWAASFSAEVYPRDWQRPGEIRISWRRPGDS